MFQGKIPPTAVFINSPDIKDSISPEHTLLVNQDTLYQKIIKRDALGFDRFILLLKKRKEWDIMPLFIKKLINSGLNYDFEQN